MNQMNKLFNRLQNEPVQVPKDFTTLIMDRLPDRQNMKPSQKQKTPSWLIALRIVSTTAAIFCIVLGITCYQGGAPVTSLTENRTAYTPENTLDIVRASFQKQNNLSYTSIKTMLNENH